MKYIQSFICMLAVGTLLLTSCDQYDDQMVAQPGGYEQEDLMDNTFIASASMSSYTIDETLADEYTSVVTIATALTPANTEATVSYDLQVATDEDFTNSTSIAFTLNGASLDVKNSDLNTMILNLTNSETEATVYFRLYAYITNSGMKTTQLASTSESSPMTTAITPYSVLKPYTEVDTVYPYYIIGMGGNWDNSVAGLGSSLIPLGLISGDAYKSNGTGTFVYTGYFSASTSFKLIGTVGSWDQQWGSSDGALSPVFNDNASSNFNVPSDGYYTITLNSINNELTIEATDVTPVSYASLGLIGDINAWGADELLTPNADTNNHIWYLTYTFSDNATEGIKIRANAAWTANWGATEFPHGIGVDGGLNIPYTSGTYTLIFNDIDKCYYFYKH